MKIVALNTRTFCAAFFAVVLMAVFSMGWAAEKEKKILVTPFQIHSEEPLDFLEAGIEKMFATRLAEPGRSTVAFASDSEDRGGLDADYIIEGTILIFGDQVSTDAKLLRVDSGTVELNFSQTGSHKGDVIKHIHLFTEEARARVLGPPPTASPSPALPVVPPVPAPVPVVAPPAVTQAPEISATPKIWRGPSMDKIIDGIQVTDIDNDGKNEILVLADKMLDIYRREGDRLVPVSELKIDEINIECFSVDAIDLDKDGQREICISAVNETHTRAMSLVYRVENMQLVKWIGPVNYLFRVVDTADGPILLGQRTRGEDAKILKTPVVELKLGPGGQGLVTSGNSFPFADNVFGIAFGDFMNNGTEIVAVLGLNGLISLYSREGEALYKGSDEYGGSAAYVAYKGMRYTRDDARKLDRIFLQQRLLGAKVGGDGKTGLVVVKNSDSAKKLLSYTRIYKKGQIDKLLWNELGLVVQERGQSLTGYVSDYCIADTDADGKKEIVFSVVSPGTLLKGKRSQIFSQQGAWKANQ